MAAVTISNVTGFISVFFFFFVLNNYQNFNNKFGEGSKAQRVSIQP